MQSMTKRSVPDRSYLRLVCGTRILLAIPLLAIPITVLGSDKLTAGRVLSAERLINIEVEIPQEDWSALCLQSRDFRTAFTNPTEKPFTYFKGNIAIDGVKIESVGIRKKGFIGSLDERWPSLKIKFDEFVSQTPVKGLDSLTLNNNKQDPSLVSQFLTYHLFN